MTTILVVVTFIDGATRGPSVSMTPKSRAEACAALQWEVARQITSLARLNVQGGASVSTEGKELIVVAGAIGKYGDGQDYQ